MTVKNKLVSLIAELPDNVVSDIYKYALFLKTEMEDDEESVMLSRLPSFQRLAERSLKEIENNDLVTLDELKKQLEN